MEIGKVVINPPHFFLEDATGFVGCNTEARPQVLLKNRTGC
jgi:hypothetical protein